MKVLISLIIILLTSSFSSELYSKIVHIRIDGGISPGSSAYITNSIKYAEDEKAKALIIELNTPGGLLDATRDIVQSIMTSRVPIVVYVSPGGARAASAGVFITLSAHVAAMSPGTNIGSAHPVGMGGNAPDSIMNDKVTNDAAAFVRSIAEERNRNAEWAERTVRESISSSEREAYELGAIDFIASDLDSLLTLLNNKKVKTSAGEITIKTDNVTIEFRKMDWREEFLFWLSNPNIAYILLMLGMYGIMFELWSPGSIFPGVLGGISLLLAFYSLQMLPVNYAGVLLIILALIMFFLEIKVTSYGLLTIGGIVSLSLGSIMLIDSPYQFMEISMSLIISVIIITAAFFAALVGFGVKAQLKKTATGNNALLNTKGIALSDFSPGTKGQVRVFGEIWAAVSDEPIKKEDTVEVIEIVHFVLTVRKTT